MYASPKMDLVVRDCRHVAMSNAIVLLVGDSGTGKGIVANAIHFWSRRAGFPFRAINLAAITEGLAESELFGHVKGAFTGAKDARPGRIRAAHHGTVFIDEIDSAALPFQARLLNTIEDRHLYPVGSDQPVSFDVRWIFASGRDLPPLVAQGLFRRDLYWRLKVVVIPIPPLRERTEDILPLARRFLDEFRKGIRLSDSVCNLLLEYPWPGNVRELQNVMECIAVRLLTSDPKADEVQPYLEPVESRPLPVRTFREQEDDARRKAIIDITRRRLSLAINPAIRRSVV